jgi:predicted phage-related endonuclease
VTQLFNFKDRASWLEGRKGMGVGSSESACLFSRPDNPLRGLSSWESPYSLSLKKRGLYEPRERDADEEQHLEWSGHIEPAIASWFAAKVLPEIGFDLDVTDPGDFAVFKDDTLPMFATIDRLLALAGEPRFVLELKNASEFMRDEWADEPPLVYQLQVQHQLSVTGLPVGYLCVSFGGGAPKWAKLPRNEAMIAILRARCSKFWDSVIRAEDPPVDAHDETARALIARYPKDDGTVTQLGDSHLATWEERIAIALEKKTMEERYALATNTLKAAIGESSSGQLPEGRLLSLRADKAGRRNLKEVSQ